MHEQHNSKNHITIYVFVKTKINFLPLPCCFSKLKKPNEDKGNRTCNITTKVIKQGDIKYIIRY